MYSHDNKTLVITLAHKLKVPLRHLANLVSVSKSTISRWINSTQKTPKISARQTLLSSKMKTDLLKLVDTNNSVTLEELKKLVLLNYNIHVSRSTLSRLLKSNNVTYKKVRKMIKNPQLDQQRLDFKTTINKIGQANVA